MNCDIAILTSTTYELTFNVISVIVITNSQILFSELCYLLM